VTCLHASLALAIAAPEPQALSVNPATSSALASEIDFNLAMSLLPVGESR
jgi:hypothetical protein